MHEISVLVSGTGSTLDNLAFHCSDEYEGMLYGHVRIKRVIADRACGAIDVAGRWNIPAFMVCNTDYLNRQEWSEVLVPDDVDLHIMAGFLGRIVVPSWAKDKILNIHPSLLPTYGGKGMYGIHVHEQVLANMESVTGCTVHIVDDEYDHGTILAQAQTVIQPWDNAKSLQKAVQGLERHLYPRTILNYLSVKH